MHVLLICTVMWTHIQYCRGGGGGEEGKKVVDACHLAQQTCKSQIIVWSHLGYSGCTVITPWPIFHPEGISFWVVHIDTCFIHVCEMGFMMRKFYQFAERILWHNADKKRFWHVAINYTIYSINYQETKMNHGYLVCWQPGFSSKSHLDNCLEWYMAVAE